MGFFVLLRRYYTSSIIAVCSALSAALRAVARLHARLRAGVGFRLVGNDQTSSIIAVSAASPRRTPVRVMRV